MTCYSVKPSDRLTDGLPAATHIARTHARTHNGSLSLLT